MVISDEERHAAASTIRQTNKGPANATIRAASDAEIDAAFADTAGGTNGDAPSRPGDKKVGGPGGRGSVAGIRVGTAEAGGGMDSRVMQNLMERRFRDMQRKLNSGTQSAPAAKMTPRQVPKKVTPRQLPADDGLEDWERDELPVVQAEPEYRPERPTRRALEPVAVDGGDMLAQAEASALSLLCTLPDGMELFVGGSSMAPHAVQIVMGLGLLIGKRLAAYRGDGHYRITAQGRAYYEAGDVE